MSKPRVFFFTEDLSMPFDEGIKNTAVALIDSLGDRVDLSGAGARCDLPPETGIEEIPSNRLLLSWRLYKAVRKSRPELILYTPRWCGTFASFVRMKVLSMYHPSARRVMLLLQPKETNRVYRPFMKMLKPDLILSPSPSVLAQVQQFGMRGEFLPLRVDGNTFVPVASEQRKEELRSKYQLPRGRTVLLHVGHINPMRNLKALIPLQGGLNQVLVVGSSTTDQVSYKDESLKGILKDNGIVVMDGYIPHIEEIYQLSDIYVFPVSEEGGCIGIPLSILEARSCGLPVVSTDFGGLRRIFNGEADGVTFAETEEFPQEIARLRESGSLNGSRSSGAVERINQHFGDVVDRLLGL